MAHIQLNFYSQSMQRNEDVIIFLPTVSADDYLEGSDIHYGTKNAKYQVLYLLHGSYGDCTDWSRFTGVERYAQDKTLAVVMPSGENSNYLNMAYGENYETYLTEELPAFLTKIFPISKKREDTFIAGLSMGGFGSLHSALKKPELYGYVASLSGALDLQLLSNGTEAHTTKMSKSFRKAIFEDSNRITDSDADLLHLLENNIADKKELPRIFMACGTEDFIYPTNENFYKKAQEMGVAIEYLRAPGVHNWDFWDAHIKDVLDWLPCRHDLVIE
ncbi:MAG: alpha/beta hydrolase family protein [Lachnospiraceae bacterium]|nr:alpha/beta hydrolase family protein [Lachnospiraceae bacterium]